MAQISKTALDSHIRAVVFDMMNVKSIEGFQKINDRQWGILVIDDEGNERYARVGVIVAEEREDMTARELMQSEIDAYNAKQAEKAEKAKAKAEKAARDKAAREAKAKEGE